jgi:excinuclease ABC subunit C
MRIRDEAHRFGITTHRRLRQKSSLSSPLDTLPGIGKSKKLELLRHFGSYKRLQQATLHDLLEVNGIGPTLAATILAACTPKIERGEQAPSEQP